MIVIVAQGWTEQDVLENYPGIVDEDIHACLAYASAALRDEKVYPLHVQ